MKIYKTKVIAKGLTGEQVHNLRRLDSSLGFIPDGKILIKTGATRYGMKCSGYWWHPKFDYVAAYALTRRTEFSHDHEISGKTLLKMLPAWAKPDFGPKNIGAKVAAFYAENDKVITRLHHSGFVVGSEDYYDWQETQPDPFRSTRLYRQSLGELRA